MTKRNESIGEVECPAKGCKLIVPVFRFQGRPNERMQRFANKLYCRCPTHGRFGGDVGDDGMQTYLEENSRKCAPVPEAGSAPANQPAPAAASQSQKMPAAPANPPAPAPAKSRWFGL